MYIEVSNPIRGAAYQVLFERFNPANCSNRDHQSGIKLGLDAVLLWAKEQPEETYDAYKWATEKMLEQLEQRMVQNELGSAVGEAFKTIARPPGK